MSKSDKSKNRSRLNPPSDDQNVIEIDETVVCRVSERTKKAETILPNFLGHFPEIAEKVNFIKVLSNGEFEVVLNKDLMDEDNGEFEKIEEFEKRIKLILENKTIEVNEKNLLLYMEYLKKNIEIPCHLTGSEDFDWEEQYVIGDGNKKEYEKLKKTNPSYTDTFKFLKFNGYINEADGLLVDVQRTTDRKKFTLPLSYLEATEEGSANYQLLDDYAIWFVNYQ